MDMFFIKSRARQNWLARERAYLERRLVTNGSIAYDHGWWCQVGPWSKAEVWIPPNFQISTLHFFLGTDFFPFFHIPSRFAFLSASAVQTSKEMASSRFYFSLSLLFFAAVSSFHHQVTFLILNIRFELWNLHFSCIVALELVEIVMEVLLISNLVLAYSSGPIN